MTYNRLLDIMAKNILRDFAREEILSLVESNLVFEIETNEYAVEIYGKSARKNASFILRLTVENYDGKFTAKFTTKNCDYSNKELYSFDNKNLENYVYFWVYGFVGSIA